MIVTEAGVDLENLEIRGDPVRYLVEFDRDDVSPSTAVVAALATVTDADPIAMEPLYETVDPDALDAVLTTSARQGRAVSVSFAIDGHELTVSGDGVVTIDPPSADALGGRTERSELE